MREIKDDFKKIKKMFENIFKTQSSSQSKSSNYRILKKKRSKVTKKKNKKITKKKRK